MEKTNSNIAEKQHSLLQHFDRLVSRLESSKECVQEYTLQTMKHDLTQFISILQDAKDSPDELTCLTSRKMLRDKLPKLQEYMQMLTQLLEKSHIFDLGTNGEHITKMCDPDISSADTTTTYGKLDEKAWSRFERQFPAGTHEYDVVQMLVKLGRESLDIFGFDENGDQLDLRRNFTTSKQEISVLGERYWLAFRDDYASLLYKEPEAVQKASRKSKKTVVGGAEAVAQVTANESESDSDKSERKVVNVKRPRTQEEKDQLKRETQLEKEREKKAKKDKKKGKSSTLVVAAAGGATSSSSVAAPRSRAILELDPTTLKKMTKTEQARLQIAISCAENLFNEIFRANGPDNTTFNKLAVREKGSCPNVILKHKYLEMRGLSLMFFAQTLYTQREKYTSEKHLKEALGMISAMIAFSDVCRGTDTYVSMCDKDGNLKDVSGNIVLRNENGQLKDASGNIISLEPAALTVDPATRNRIVVIGNKTYVVEMFVDGRIDGKYIEDPCKNAKISATMIADIKLWVEKLMQIYPYDGETIQRVAPHLLIIPDFSEAIPSSGLLPREFQFNAMKKIVSMIIKKGVLAITPAIGVGKTTLMIAVAILLQECIARHIIPADEKMIYVCDTDSVRTQFGLLCYNAGLPFALMTTDPITGRPLIRNHFNCGKPGTKKPTPDEKRVAMITDTATACLFFTQIDSSERDKFILALDEPTIGADIMGSANIRTNVNLLSMCPCRTICISATMPKFEEIPLIVEHIRSRHLPNHEEFSFESVTSNELQIGISLYTYNKSYWAPYIGCSSQQDVRNIIVKLSTDSFLMRTCTSDVLLTLAGAMRDAGISETPDIARIFSSPKMLNPKNVMRVCLETLDVLSRQENSIITTVCSAQVMTRWNTDRAHAEEQDDMFERAPTVSMTEPITPHLLGTRQAKIFNGPLLVSTGDPFGFARRNFGRLFHDVITEIRSMKNIVDKYESAMNTHKKAVDRISERDATSDRDKSMKIQETEEGRPVFAFPSYGVIGSNAHFYKYSGKDGSSTNVRASFGLLLENSEFKQKEHKKEKRLEHSAFLIPVNEMQTPDWIIVLLFCGIGFYAEQSDQLCQVYRKTVSRLASEGLLAMVVADGTISYGTNWPFTNVYVDESFVRGRALLADGSIVDVIRSLYFLFQNLGRAGRFGKSWRANAYFSQFVADMLTDYAKGLPLLVSESANMDATLLAIIAEADAKADTDYAEKECKRKENEERLTTKRDGLTVHRTSYSSSNVVPPAEARRVAVEKFVEESENSDDDSEAEQVVQVAPDIQPVGQKKLYKPPVYQSTRENVRRNDYREESSAGGGSSASGWSRTKSHADSSRPLQVQDRQPPSSSSSGRWERNIQSSQRKFGGVRERTTTESSQSKFGGNTNGFGRTEVSRSDDRHSNEKKTTSSSSEGMWRRTEDKK